ncbi:hypothetical protein Tco_1003069 [Tanacetum coccineum]|uniref:Uncharacterized protein n=1 Tax=Tanacetum coccineum TaxID=301880 RepID=A0ABQ5F817_9ASTR
MIRRDIPKERLEAAWPKGPNAYTARVGNRLLEDLIFRDYARIHKSNILSIPVQKRINQDGEENYLVAEDKNADIANIISKSFGKDISMSTANHPETDRPEREEPNSNSRDMLRGMRERFWQRLETTEKIVQIKHKDAIGTGSNKWSNADRKRQPMEFEVGDKYMLNLTLERSRTDSVTGQS